MSALFHHRPAITILAAAAAVWALATGHHLAVAGPAINLDARASHPVAQLGRHNVFHVKVGLQGNQPETPTRRPAVNVCFAIDKSGSMSGDKIAAARRGAVSALAQLRASDVVSVVAYDNTVRVLVPATRASDKAAIARGINRLSSGGNTALFAGVSKCAAEVRKFKSNDRVNRIILLSDGQANEGPSSPAALGALGQRLGRAGISVSTIGLGLDYNEDLMTALAMRSDGRHTFVREAGELAQFFDEELGAVTSIVASDATVRIRFESGARPVRVLGRPADIVGSTVTTTFGKVYASRDHFLIVEVEMPAAATSKSRTVADVDVSYRDLVRGQTTTSSRKVDVRFSESLAEIERAADKGVLGEVAMLQADERAAEAVVLRDAGRVDEACQVLEDNAATLEKQMNEYGDKRLRRKVMQNKQDAADVTDTAKWRMQRKRMRKTLADDPLDGLAL